MGNTVSIGRARWKVWVGSTVLTILLGTSLGLKIRHDDAAIDSAWKEFYRGNLPLIEGPYLSIGNAKTLHFKATDLGITDEATMSENGDVLYTFCGAKAETYLFKDVDGFSRNGVREAKREKRLRRRNGQIEVLDYANQYALTPGGKLACRTTQSELFLDGKPVNQDHNANRPDPRTLHASIMPFVVSDEAFFDRDYHKQNAPYFAFNDKATYPLPEVTGELHHGESSSQLGTFWPNFESKALGSGSWTLKNFHNGSLKTIELPSQMHSGPVGIKICRDTVYLDCVRRNCQSLPYKLVDGRFERQPVPPNSYSTSVTAASSKDRYVLMARYIRKDKEDLYRTAISGMEQFFVEGSVAYPLKDILEQAGLLNGSLTRNWSECPMDAQGNMLISKEVDGFNHVFLLERTP